MCCTFEHHERHVNVSCFFASQYKKSDKSQNHNNKNWQTMMLHDVVQKKAIISVSEVSRTSSNRLNINVPVRTLQYRDQNHLLLFPQLPKWNVCSAKQGYLERSYANSSFSILCKHLNHLPSAMSQLSSCLFSGNEQTHSAPVLSSQALLCSLWSVCCRLLALSSIKQAIDDRRPPMEE